MAKSKGATNDKRQNGKASKSYPKVFDAVKRRVVTAK